MLLLMFYVDVIFLCFMFLSTTSNSTPRKVYLPDPDQTVMKKWEREVGREVKEDENHF